MRLLIKQLQFFFFNKIIRQSAFGFYFPPSVSRSYRFILPDIRKFNRGLLQPCDKKGISGYFFISVYAFRISSFDSLLFVLLLIFIFQCSRKQYFKQYPSLPDFTSDRIAILLCNSFYNSKSKAGSGQCPAAGRLPYIKWGSLPAAGH